MIAGSSGLAWARAARRTGMLSRRTMTRWGFTHLRFRLRGASDEATDRVMAEISELLSGVSARQIGRMSPAVLAGVLPKLYPRMLEEVHAHQDAGRATLIVSAAGDELVRLVARVLDMDGGIGTAYEIGEQGLLTGRLGGPFIYGEGKVEAIRAYSSEHGIDLAASYAYSDSISDLPMLRAVGQPVAVNPDAGLAELARAEGWRILWLDRLGRRMALATALAAALALGAAGSRLLERRRRPATMRLGVG